MEEVDWRAAWICSPLQSAESHLRGFARVLLLSGEIGGSWTREVWFPLVEIGGLLVATWRMG